MPVVPAGVQLGAERGGSFFVPERDCIFSVGSLGTSALPAAEPVSPSKSVKSSPEAQWLLGFGGGRFVGVSLTADEGGRDIAAQSRNGSGRNPAGGLNSSALHHLQGYRVWEEWRGFVAGCLLRSEVVTTR